MHPATAPTGAGMYLSAVRWLCTASTTDERSLQTRGWLMFFLSADRLVLDMAMPGLDDKLAAAPAGSLETSAGQGISLFQAAGGSRLLAPTACGGTGATAVQAVAVQRAVGSRSGSLAVATTMHHFSMASLVALGRVGTGLEWILIEGVARQDRLLASGFAEGKPGAGILSPTMRATSAPGGLLVSGVKKPCSLARSMTMLTASVAVRDEDGRDRLAVVLVPADAPGVRVEKFWGSPVLAGAESDAVILDDVLVPEELVVRTAMTSGDHLDVVHRIGFLWFELLMTASYVGIGAGLVEKVLTTSRASDEAVLRLAAPIDLLASALDSLAAELDSGRDDDALLTRVLLTRFAAQDLITSVASQAAEALGGMSYIASEVLATEVASTQCLAFHPPSRGRSAAAVVAALKGAALTFD